MRVVRFGGIQHAATGCPPRLGSSARRRGRDADTPAAAVTTRDGERRDGQEPQLDLGRARSRRSASGHTSSRLSLVRQEQQHRRTAGRRARRGTSRRGRRRPRREPAAGHEAQDQRDEERRSTARRTSRTSVNATGESTCTRIADDEDAESRDGQQAADRAVGAPAPRDEAARREGRRRRACGSPRSPGPAAPRSKSTGIRATKLAAAAADPQRQPEPRARAWEPSAGSAPCARPRATGRATSSRSSDCPWRQADHPAQPTLTERAEPRTVRLAAPRGTSARSEERGQPGWEGRGVIGRVEHVPHRALRHQEELNETTDGGGRDEQSAER